ncbi:MAG: hypothetical protein AABX93_00435 [Nanoarchaeota archaeon]
MINGILAKEFFREIWETSGFIWALVFLVCIYVAFRVTYPKLAEIIEDKFKEEISKIFQ